MTTRFLLLAFLFLCRFHSLAQQSNIPNPDTKPLLQRGTDLYDSAEYKKAIIFLQQIPHGDTNYEVAQSLLGAAYIQDSNFTKGIEVTRALLQEDLTDRPQVYINLLSAYDGLNMVNEAFGILDTFQKEYPNDNRPYYERAVVHFHRKDFDAAEKQLQQSLLLNPRHYRSNVLLAAIYLEQGRFSEALMALGTSLFFNDNVDRAKLVIGSIAQIATQNEEVQGYYRNRKAPDRTFDELDELIQSKIALDRAYKLKSSLEDEVVRQYQLLSEQIKYDPSNKNFSNQFYVPLYSKLFKEDKFEGMILLMFSGYGINSVEKIISSRKGKDDLADAKQEVHTYFDKIIGTRTLNYNEREKKENLIHLLPQENLVIHGKAIKVKGEKALTGPTKYYRNGSLIAEGIFNEVGKKTGEWKYYYPNGNMRLQEYYEDGNLVKKYTRWWKNGNLDREGLLNEKGEEKQIQFYDLGGNKTVLAKADGAKNVSRQVTYKSGQIKTVENFTDGKRADGTQTFYSIDGKVTAKEQFKNDKLDGAQTYYYNDGTLSSEDNFKDGEKVGLQKNYYRNGKLSREFIAEKGEDNGKLTEYGIDGQKMEEHTFKNGKLHGKSTYYNREGIAYGSIDLNNGRPYSAKFTGSDGKPMSAAEEAIRNNIYMGLYPNGVPRFKMPFDSRGLTTGKAEYFYEYGVLSKVITYKDDKQNGEYIEYFRNGNKSLKAIKKDGEFYGPYQVFYRNGQLNSEGWLSKGKQEGAWTYYNEDGSLYRTCFLADGERNGNDNYHFQNGKKDYILRYTDGFLMGYTQYDTTGKILQRKSFTKGNGQQTFFNTNGTIRFEAPVVNGNYHGTFNTYYSNKTLRTTGTYRYGFLNGKRTVLYPNGKPYVIKQYVEGEQSGPMRRYWPDGTLYQSAHYHDNDLYGMDTIFVNNKPRYITEYYNDTEHGEEKIFGDNHQLAAVLYYHHGVMLGYSYEGKDGKLLPMISLPKATGSINTTYANGAKALIWKIEANNLEGQQLLYYSNGQLAEDKSYKKGVLHGMYVRYYPDGKKNYEVNFANNLMQGKRRYYNNQGKLILEENYINDEQHGEATYSDGISAPITITYYYGN